MVENSYVDLCLYLVGNLFRIYVVFRFLRLFFESSQFGKRVISTVFFVYFMVNSMLFLCFHSPWLNLISNLLLSFALTFLYRGKMRRRLVAVVLIYATNLACEELVYRMMICTMGENNLALGIIVPNLILFPLVMVLEKLSDMKYGYQTSAINWICTVYVPALSIFIIGVVLKNINHDLIAVCAISGLLLMNVVVFYLMDHLANAYRRACEFEIRQRQSQAFEEQLKLKKNADEHMKRLRHDLKNHLIALRGMAQEKQCGKIITYLDDMNGFIQNKGEYVHCGNIVLDSILNMKLEEATRLGAETKVQICVPNKIGIADLDLNLILGNLLDNALRALEDCADKILFVEIRLDQNVFFIKIQNSYKGLIKQHAGIIATTKRNRKGHGIGLSSVKQTAEKYNGQLSIHYDEEIFSAKVVLYIGKIDI